MIIYPEEIEKRNLPNGTAPEDPAVSKKKFSRRTIVKISLLIAVNKCRQCRISTNVGKAVAVTIAFFFRFVPPRVTYARLEKYPPILWNENEFNEFDMRLRDLPSKERPEYHHYCGQ